MKISGVYQIVNTITGDCYIGSSIVGECEEECELLDRAEQFLREVGDDSKRVEKGY